MMLRLVLDIFLIDFLLRGAHAEGAVPFLPRKFDALARAASVMNAVYASTAGPSLRSG